jgi:hypothetical protein
LPCTLSWWQSRARAAWLLPPLDKAISKNRVAAI